MVCKKECAPCSLSVGVLPLSLIPPYVSCAWTGDCSLITEMGPDNGVYTWCRTGSIGGEREWIPSGVAIQVCAVSLQGQREGFDRS